MKSLYLLGCFLLIGLLLLACNQGDDAPTPDVEATVQVAVEATLQAAAKATAQTIVAEATLAAPPTGTPEPVLSEGERERPYRSYPAPTGLPGFRLYYQKRCYPGCHTGDTDQVHP